MATLQELSALLVLLLVVVAPAEAAAVRGTDGASGVSLSTAWRRVGPLQRQQTNSEKSLDVEPQREYDVIVVGSGIAGLTAARNLARGGASVLVLEARSVLGGRCNRTAVATFDGSVVPCPLPECPEGKWWWDQGGQWVGPTQERFLAMIEEYGEQRYESDHIKGQARVYMGRDSTLEPGVVLPPEFVNGLPLPPEALAALTPEQRASLEAEEALTARLYQLAASVNVSHPWETPDAEALDSITFQSWLDQNSDNAYAKHTVAALYPVAGGALGGMKPAHVSLLHVARQMAAAPQVDKPEKWLLWGGAGQFVPLLSAEIERLGGRLLVNAPVSDISQGAEGVEVTTHDPRGSGPDRKFRAKYVIVAMPPHLSGRIVYSPPLPRMRNQLVDRTPMGTTVKVLAFYERPLWRRPGSNASEGVTFVLDPRGHTSTSKRWVDSVYDVSPPNGPGVLASFLWADDALELMAQGIDAVQRQVLSTWADYMGCPEVATQAINFAAVDWPSEQFVGGAFTAYMPPGVWTTYGPALVRPVGRIHWAGTENSPTWPGFFEGAVLTGEQAAETVGTLLAQEHKQK